MWPRINLYHCMRGYAENFGGSGAHGVGLFNDSPQNHYLVLRDVRSGSTSGTSMVVRSAQPQAPVTPLGTVVTVVTGEALGPGVLYSVNDTAFPVPADYPLGRGSGIQAGWVHEFPFAVLQPGWSLEALMVAGVATWIGFWWEYVTPAEMRAWWEIEAQGG